MEQLASLAAIIAVPTLSPGPNNFIVMAQATSRGLRATIPAILAIALGSAIMLAVVARLAGFEFIEHRLAWIAAGGSLALGMLAVRQWICAGRTTAATSSAIGSASLVLLQWLNPNSWILVVVVAAAATAAQVRLSAMLALLIGVSIASSLCWAVFGGAIAHMTRRRSGAIWVERLLAAALFAAAANIFLAHMGDL